MASIVQPNTILAWHRKLVAQKFDGSPQRKAVGRPKIDAELDTLVVRMAQENRAWGYDRIVGALKHLGYTINDQTVGNMLKHHGIPPAPERKKTTTWKEFIRTHLEVRVATGLLTTEVWTMAGLVTYYVRTKRSRGLSCLASDPCDIPCNSMKPIIMPNAHTRASAMSAFFLLAACRVMALFTAENGRAGC